MIDIKKYSSSLSKVSNESTLNFGNKLSVLGGDFLLAKASLELGKLENTEVVELISRAIGNLSEGSTMASLPLVGQEQQECSLKDWEDFVFLMKGSLLANSCEAAVTLMDHDRTIRYSAYEFGKNLALAQACSQDIEQFHAKKKPLPQWNYLLLSSLEHSEDLRQSYYDKYANHEASVTVSSELRKHILKELPTIETNVKIACEEKYVRTCERCLEVFPTKNSVEAIKKILRTVCE